LDDGFVYATVTISPKTTGLARVNWTFVPEITTELTVLTVEFTRTENEDEAGTIFARDKLYVISRREGVAS
jgi:hypothetical protein